MKFWDPGVGWLSNEWLEKKEQKKNQIQLWDDIIIQISN